MEHKALGKYKAGIFSTLSVYRDRIEFRGPITKKVIPMSMIADVSSSKLGTITIETSGGQKSEFPISGGKADEVAGVIVSQLT